MQSPSLLNIDSQSVKVAPFVAEDTGVDGNKKINGRKRHVITDTLGLVWQWWCTRPTKPTGLRPSGWWTLCGGYLHRTREDPGRRGL